MSYNSCKNKKVDGLCGKVHFMENFIERRPSTMKRLTKSEVLHKELNQILAGIFDDLAEGKLEGRESWLSMIMKKGAAFFLQQLLEKEATEFLGRDHYQRAKGEENRSGYPNGYEPRKIRTGEGKMEVYLPQVSWSLPTLNTEV